MDSNLNQIAILSEDDLAFLDKALFTQLSENSTSHSASSEND